MKISVFIDSCAWNYLYANNISLAEELPVYKYDLYVTKEIEIELSSIPDFNNNEGSDTDKLALKKYINNSFNERVKTTSVFGFVTYEADGTPSKAQTYGGFGQGTFISKEETEYYASTEINKFLYGKSKRNTGLGINQADASLGVKASHSIVLTNDKKNGPLKYAAEHGGYVVFLNDKPIGISIDKYLSNNYDLINIAKYK